MADQQRKIADTSREARDRDDKAESARREDRTEATRREERAETARKEDRAEAARKDARAEATRKDDRDSDDSDDGKSGAKDEKNKSAEPSGELDLNSLFAEEEEVDELLKDLADSEEEVNVDDLAAELQAFLSELEKRTAK